MDETITGGANGVAIAPFAADSADASAKQRVAHEVTALHAAYYGREWGFGVQFSEEVEREVAGFLARFDPARDGIWLACTVGEKGGETVGAAAIDGSGEPQAGSRLRWFILDPRTRGLGAGRKLMAEALAFCRSSDTPRVYLWTFAGLEAARRLYDEAGFVLVEESADDAWGRRVTHQRFELALARLTVRPGAA